MISIWGGYIENVFIGFILKEFDSLILYYYLEIFFFVKIKLFKKEKVKVIVFVFKYIKIFKLLEFWKFFFRIIFCVFKGENWLI